MSMDSCACRRILRGAARAWNDEAYYFAEPAPKTKRDQLSLARVRDFSPANRPDPDGPGGLGAEESGTERTGSTQDYLLASQRGGRWAEVGQQYDSANVPVTRCFWSADN